MNSIKMFRLKGKHLFIKQLKNCPKSRSKGAFRQIAIELCG